MFIIFKEIKDFYMSFQPPLRCVMIGLTVLLALQVLGLVVLS